MVRKVETGLKVCVAFAPGPISTSSWSTFSTQHSPSFVSRDTTTTKRPCTTWGEVLSKSTEMWSQAERREESGKEATR